MNKKKKVVMARLVLLKEADDSFDFEFWRKAGAGAIFEAMFQMVVDYLKLKGRYNGIPRLRRSVAKLKRR